MRKLFLVVLGVMFVASAAFATYYTDKTIYDIQYVADPATDDASPLVGDTVTIEAYVTFEPRSWSSTKFFVADDGGAWNGVYVYDADYRALELGFGWKISFTAEVMEYYNITELALVDTSEVRVISKVVDWDNLPAACQYTVVSAADLDNTVGGAATAEQYESVLVQANDLTCSGTASYGEWYATDTATSTYTVKIDDSGKGYFHKVIDTQPYEYIRGILYYDYSEYKIAPETGFDLRVAVDPDNGWYQQFSYMLQNRPMDLTVQYDAGDGFTTDTSLVIREYGYTPVYRGIGALDTTTIKGVITMADGVSYAGAGVKFIFADATYALDADPVEQPWSSVMVYNSDSTSFPTLPVGYVFECSGYVGEFINGDANMSEFFITTFSLPTFGLTVPAPVEFTVEDMRDPEMAEMYENAFVYFKDVMVSNDAPTYEVFAVDDVDPDAIPPFGIDADSDWDGSPYETAWAEFVTPITGTAIDSITGWIYAHYGSWDDSDGDNWVYKLCPIDPETDMVFGGLAASPPTFTNGGRAIASPTTSDAVGVGYTVVDEGSIDSVKVFYRVGDTGDFIGVMMTADVDTFTAEIPAQAEGSDVWYYFQAWDNSVTTTTKPADIETDMFGYHVTDGDLTIHDVQWTTYADANSRYEGYEVTVTGVISVDAEVAYEYNNASSYGTAAYFLQDGTEPEWSAMLAFVPTELITDPGQTLGDEVTITGTVYEGGSSKYAGMTNLADVTSITVNSTGNDVTVHEYTVPDLDGNEEALEAQVVKVLTLQFQSATSYDWYFNDASSNEIILARDMVRYIEDQTANNWFAGLSDGSITEVDVDWVQGIWCDQYGSRELVPRGMSDISALETSVSEITGLPESFKLYPVYPNPFNPSTTVSFDVPMTSNVKVTVYNMLGQQVKSLVNKPMQAGNHKIVWHGVNDTGMPVASGIYFLRFDAGNFQKMQKMVLVK